MQGVVSRHDLLVCGAIHQRFGKRDVPGGLARLAIERDEANFAEEMVSPEEGVARAIAIARTAQKPVVIADTQDNPGCGGTADATGLLNALVAADAQGAVLGAFLMWYVWVVAEPVGHTLMTAVTAGMPADSVIRARLLGGAPFLRLFLMLSLIHISEPTRPY